MSRTYATLKLLEHGPLSMIDLQVITGWPYFRCRNAIRLLQSDGRIGAAVNGVYALGTV